MSRAGRTIGLPELLAPAHNNRTVCQMGVRTCGVRTAGFGVCFGSGSGLGGGWLPLRLHVDLRALDAGPVQTTTFALAWWGQARRHVMGEVLLAS